MHLVQLFRRGNSRVVGVAGASKALRLLAASATTRQLALEAHDARKSPDEWVRDRLSDELQDYDGALNELWFDACAPGRPPELPDYAEDGREEAEVAGLYVVAEDGAPLRLGFAIGN